jgi:hypothetical protein
MVALRSRRETRGLIESQIADGSNAISLRIQRTVPAHATIDEDQRAWRWTSYTII